jgi:hypothetical protein
MDLNTIESGFFHPTGSIPKSEDHLLDFSLFHPAWLDSGALVPDWRGPQRSVTYDFSIGLASAVVQLSYYLCTIPVNNFDEGLEICDYFIVISNDAAMRLESVSPHVVTARYNQSNTASCQARI